jgi:hypothetical protein
VSARESKSRTGAAAAVAGVREVSSRNWIAETVLVISVLYLLHLSGWVHRIIAFAQRKTKFRRGKA